MLVCASLHKHCSCQHDSEVLNRERVLSKVFKEGPLPGRWQLDQARLIGTFFCDVFGGEKNKTQLNNLLLDHRDLSNNPGFEFTPGSGL